MANKDVASLPSVKTKVKQAVSQSVNAGGETELFDNLTSGEWYTAEQAAQYLKVSLGSLFNMTSNGTIRCFKLGRRNRYRLEDLRSLFKPKGQGGSHGC